jgi:hypothetical protein
MGTHSTVLYIQWAEPLHAFLTKKNLRKTFQKPNLPDVFTHFTEKNLTKTYQVGFEKKNSAPQNVR